MTRPESSASSSPCTCSPSSSEPFEALLDSRLEAAGDDMAELCKVAEWTIDKAIAGDVAAMVAVIDMVDGPAEFADE